MSLERLIRTLRRMEMTNARERPARADAEAHGCDALAIGGREWCGRHGLCWVRDVRVEDASLLDRIRPTFSGPPHKGARGWPDRWTCPRLAVLDTETCGFAGMPIFLVGILRADVRGLLAMQGLARDYAEEAALLEWTEHTLRDVGGLITFNGKAFDMPGLRTRRVHHRLPPMAEPPHVDLLHIARRIWGETLPNCRLQTLERFVVGRAREDDIPGYAIPDAYHRFVHTKDMALMRTILAHNMCDIYTLMELFVTAWHHLRAQGTR